MKKLLLAALLCPTTLFCQKLEGAFLVTGARYGDYTLSANDIARKHIVKIFKDGYWIVAFFGDPQNSFDGTGAGNFSLAAPGKYSETLAVYSWDSTAVGQRYNFDYTVSGDKYTQDGRINSDKYKDYIIREEFARIKTDVPLKDTSLEGAWQLESASWGGEKLGEGEMKDVKQIKLYSYPRFAWVQYNAKTNQFVGAGGGTYQYDGEKLTEHIEYITYQIALHTDFNITVNKKGARRIEQVSWGGGTTETWTRLVNH